MEGFGLVVSNVIIVTQDENRKEILIWMKSFFDLIHAYHLAIKMEIEHKMEENCDTINAGLNKLNELVKLTEERMEEQIERSIKIIQTNEPKEEMEIKSKRRKRGESPSSSSSSSDEVLMYTNMNPNNV